MHRVIFNHCLILECGNWKDQTLIFKFEKRWLQTENFKETEDLVGLIQY